MTPVLMGPPWSLPPHQARTASGITAAGLAWHKGLVAFASGVTPPAVSASAASASLQGRSAVMATWSWRRRQHTELRSEILWRRMMALTFPTAGGSNAAELASAALLVHRGPREVIYLVR